MDPLLFLPGASGRAAFWAPVAARLPPGRSHVLAQSMGGVLALRLALERPERVDRLVLCATSGGLDLASLGAADWRPDYRAALPDVPGWFLADRTNLSARLGEVRAFLA